MQDYKMNESSRDHLEDLYAHLGYGMAETEDQNNEFIFVGEFLLFGENICRAIVLPGLTDNASMVEWCIKDNSLINSFLNWGRMVEPGVEAYYDTVIAYEFWNMHPRDFTKLMNSIGSLKMDIIEGGTEIDDNYLTVEMSDNFRAKCAAATANNRPAKSTIECAATVQYDDVPSLMEASVCAFLGTMGEDEIGELLVGSTNDMSTLTTLKAMVKDASESGFVNPELTQFLVPSTPPEVATILKNDGIEHNVARFVKEQSGVHQIRPFRIEIVEYAKINNSKPDDFRDTFSKYFPRVDENSIASPNEEDRQKQKDFKRRRVLQKRLIEKVSKTILVNRPHVTRQVRIIVVPLNIVDGKIILGELMVIPIAHMNPLHYVGQLPFRIYPLVSFVIKRSGNTMIHMMDVWCISPRKRAFESNYTIPPRVEKALRYIISQIIQFDVSSTFSDYFPNEVLIKIENFISARDRRNFALTSKVSSVRWYDIYADASKEEMPCLHTYKIIMTCPRPNFILIGGYEFYVSSIYDIIEFIGSNKFLYSGLVTDEENEMMQTISFYSNASISERKMGLFGRYYSNCYLEGEFSNLRPTIFRKSTIGLQNYGHNYRPLSDKVELRDLMFYYNNVESTWGTMHEDDAIILKYLLVNSYRGGNFVAELAEKYDIG